MRFPGSQLQGLATHKIKNFLLTVLFELTIAVAWSVASWLLVVRARTIPEMFSKAEEILTSNGRLFHQHPLKRRLIHLLLALSPIWLVANIGLGFYNSGNMLCLGNNSLPLLFNAMMRIASVLQRTTLLSLSVHMMQLFSGVFEAISTDLERELPLDLRIL